MWYKSLGHKRLFLNVIGATMFLLKKVIFTDNLDQKLNSTFFARTIVKNDIMEESCLEWTPGSNYT